MDDIGLLLYDSGIPDARLDEAVAALTFGDRVSLLNCVAQRYCEVAKLKLLASELSDTQKQHIRAEVKALMKEQSTLVSNLKTKLSL